MGMHVLVVDDNAVNAILACEVLKEAGYAVSSAASGEAALAALALSVPSLLLLDMHLPGISGFEVLRRLRSSPAVALRTLPVIAATALAMRGDREACLEAGADDYLPRPFNADTLVARVRRLLAGNDETGAREIVA